MKKLSYLIAFFLILPVFGMSQEKTIYDFTVEDIDGNEFSFSELKGKKIMVVNVASKCGAPIENGWLSAGG